MLSSEKLINKENNDTFCKVIMKLVDGKKLSSSEKYFVNEKKLLHKVVRKDDKSLMC